MCKVLIIYDSLTGNTARAAGLIAEGLHLLKMLTLKLERLTLYQ
ncbi:MAG: hypothetical protein QXW82_03460 [Candidatus Bathyarchaeia archaeon]